MLEQARPAGACSAKADKPIDFANGQILLSADDLSAGGFGQSWGHTRSYNNQMSTDVDYGNGINWLVAQWPYLINESLDTIIVVKAGQNSLWFDAGGGGYVGRFGILQTLTYDAGADEYTLSQPTGETEVYAGFSGANAGKLLRQVTPGQTAVDMTYDGGLLAEMQRSVTIGGEEVLESYSYSYFTSGDNIDHVSSVVLKRRVGATGPWANIRRSRYSYYGSGDPSGPINNLRSVTRETAPDGLTWQSIGTDFYRYYVDDAGGTGFANGLKFVVQAEAFARLSAAFGDPFLATDEQVARFADHYFEYDVERRVTAETVAAGTVKATYVYEESAFSDARTAHNESSS
jgi:hypothetical protein